MNSKHTFTWFIVAVSLLAFIFAYEFLQRSGAPESSQVFPGLHPSAATLVQVIPAGAPEISAQRTNNDWSLTQPVAYPARRDAIENLLEALQKLQAAVRITSAELSQNHDANAQYGFDSPQMSLVVQQGDDRREILVGNKTAPGDQVFLRIVGSEGVLVVDAAWLKFIPQSATDWRDTAMISTENNCDTITLTNGTKVIALNYNTTNHLWQMTHPLAARANGDYISKALQQLQATHATQFITDNSNADLTAFGLQPSDLDLWLGHGTNFIAGLHLGKTSTNDSSQMFARRESWSAIMTTPKQPLSPWYGAVNDFRDPYLVELTAPVAEVELIGPGTNHYSVQLKGPNAWQIPGENIPIDPDTVQYLIQTVARLRISDFVKDVATPADWPAFGLATPSRQIILRSAIGDTNAVIAQLLFGSNNTNEVFVRRADEENFIYGIAPEDFNRLPEGAAWQFRDRRIWNFTEADVTQITVHQDGKTMQILHNGPNKWALAAGSQGIVNAPALEEVAHDLGNMAAVVWWSRGVTNPAEYGLKPDNLSITITLKNGQALTTDFGAPLSGQTALAAVTLDGERWVYLFPPAVYALVMSYLALPPGNP